MWCTGNQFPFMAFELCIRFLAQLLEKLFLHTLRLIHIDQPYQLTTTRKIISQWVSILFHEYSDDKLLCVVVCIHEYLRRSAPWRTQAQNQLLLEFQSSTIDNWWNLCLKWRELMVHFTRLILLDKTQLLRQDKVQGISFKDIFKRD